MRVALSLFVICAFLVVSCNDKKEGIKPEYRNVTEAVYSTVTVQPRNAYKVYPKVGSIIEELMIEEGDEIKKGDLILRLTDKKSNVNVQNAQLKYEIAKESYNGESAKLKDIKEQIKTAIV